MRRISADRYGRTRRDDVKTFVIFISRFQSLQRSTDVISHCCLECQKKIKNNYSDDIPW